MFTYAETPHNNLPKGFPESVMDEGGGRSGGRNPRCTTIEILNKSYT